MSTHSSILAWSTPWTEEPGRLWFIWSQSDLTAGSAVLITLLYYLLGFPGGSDGKESACNAGEPGSLPGLGRSLGKGNVNPL